LLPFSEGEEGDIDGDDSFADKINLATLLPYKFDDVVARRDGKFVYPMILTPFDVVTT
jgi:hypothetical protein